VDGRQVLAAALGREAVEHGADELHQRRLARFVGAIDDRRVVRQFVDCQGVPDAEAVDVDVFDSHGALLGCSPPVL
jgi:hypothetical protein